MIRFYTGMLFSMMIILLLCNFAWARQEVSLNGEWEVKYSQDGTYNSERQWTKVAVPSHLNQQEEQYVWYRRSFAVPDSMSGKRIFLKFGGVKFVSEVYVNGKSVGGHYGGWEPFELEITDSYNNAENQLLIKVTDVRGVVDQQMNSSQSRSVSFIEQAKDSIMAPVGSQTGQFGIWQDVSVEARSDVYIEDVFVRTSVRSKIIEVDYILKNLSDRKRTVLLESKVYDGENVRLKMGAVSVELSPQSSAKATLRKAWSSPKLWSPGSPYLYSLISWLREDGQQADRDVRAPLDEVATRFGFREFWVDGIYFLLNGTRIKLLATSGHPGYGSTKEDAKKLYSDIQSANCVAMRLHANIWPESWYEAADEVGMLLIQESALWCYAQQYALSKDKFWVNVRAHLNSMIRRDKNHPSVVIYSIENEILHVGGTRLPGTEKRLADLGRFVKSKDPTRPIMYDGDADPMGIADIENLHYPHEFPDWNLWPNTAYWVDEKTNVSGYPYREWRWERKKPLYFGEFLWTSFQTPDPYTIFVGDNAYLDYNMAKAQAKAVAWGMQIEAFRAAEVSGMCPWTLLEAGKFPNVQYDAIKRAYEPNAAFVKEYDSRFFSGEIVPRTIYLYNDTPHSADLDLIWQLKGAGKTVDSGKQGFKLNPAERISTVIELRMPDVSERTPLSLTLQVKNGNKSVFQDEKLYWAFPKKALRIPKGGKIAVYSGDIPVPLGDMQYISLKSLSDISAEVQLLIVGPHALDSMKSQGTVPSAGDESAPGARLASFVRDGGTVFVMQQSVYPDGLLPASLTDHSATIAFRRAPESEILNGTSDEDLQMWRGDNLVSVNDISKPAGGCFIPVIDSGGKDGLAYSPLMEVFAGQGRYILCQLSLIRERAEPIAEILLQNIVNYALKPSQGRVKAAIVQHELNIKQDVESVGAISDDLSGKLSESSLKDYRVIIMEGSAPELAANLVKIKDFVETGGKALIHSLKPGDSAKLQGLFPEEITLSRSSSLPVTLCNRDPVISGLSNQDLYWLGENTGSWYSQTPLSLEVTDYVVSKGLPEPEKCQVIEAESMAVEYGDPVIQDDTIYMYANAAIAAEVNLPNSVDYIFGVRANGTPFQGTYPEVTLFVDGTRRISVMLSGPDWEIYTMTTKIDAGKHKVTLAFTNDAYDPVTKADRNLSLDKLIYAEAQSTVVKRLLTPPSLAEVPLGEGFFLIDQIDWHGRAASLDKAARYLANLLVNLGVSFTEEVGVLSIAGDQMKPAEDLKLYSLSDSIAHLATNGYIFTDIQFASSREYTFQVSAKGTAAGGEYPNVRLMVDWDIIGDRMLHRSGWETLTFRAFVNAGTHRVSLVFTNDLWEPPADRNLDIRQLRVR